MYDVYFSSEAESDLREATEWYEEQRIGLGQDFVSYLDTSLHMLQKNPKLYQVLYKNIRSVLIKKYPYCIFYNIEEEKKEIHIFALLHTKRNPEIWLNRM